MRNPEQTVSIHDLNQLVMNARTICAGGEAEDEAGDDFWVGVLDREIEFTL